MRRKAIALFPAAVLLLAVASACGAHKNSTTSSPTMRPTTTAAAKPAFKSSLTATSHHPVVNNTKWAITVRVTNLAGNPIAASLYMQVLYNGRVVGPIDGDKKGRAKVYHFVGRHHEYITWPPLSVGQPLKLQAIVTVKGQTQKLNWPIRVVAK